MRILKLVNSNDDGGVFTCERQYIECLQAHGHEVDLVIIGESKSLEVYRSLANNYVVLPELDAQLSGGVTKIIQGIKAMKEFAKKQLPVVSNSLGNTYDCIIYRRPTYLFLAGFLSEHFLIKAYWHMPNIARSVFSKIFYYSFLTQYRIKPLANSEFTRQSLGLICKDVVYPGYDPKRVANGFDSFREELRIPEEHIVYGVVARICKDKAQDLLIEAFCKSIGNARNVHLIIAGAADSDAFLSELRRMAGPHLNSQIHFIGKISNLPKFYSTIDIAVNSRRNVEAFGISVAEALGASKPVLAYRLGGPSEMITEGVNGWLVQSPTVQGYKEKLEKSFVSRDVIKKMGQCSKEIAKKFEVETNVEKLIAIIEKYRND